MERTRASHPDRRSLGTEGLLVARATPEVGTRIGGRYRLAELMRDYDGIAFWHATDEMLARPVGIYLIPEDHDLAEAVVAAAQAAANIDDPRFVRILDAVRTDEVVHVIQEWIPTARPVRVVLAEEGPLGPADAQVMITEAAEALSVAHEAGLAHLRLQPNTVLITPAGQVKIFGLCVEAALHGTTAVDPARADTRGLARVLYAMLTAKWPEGEAFGLPAAPYENGAICTPRQVRAGVPDAVDSIVDRVLNPRPRAGSPLRTPAELAAAIRKVPHRTPSPPPAKPSAPRTFAPPTPSAASGPSWRPSNATRGAQIGVAFVLALGLSLLGWQIARAIGSGSGSNSDATGADALQTIPIADVIDFDPAPGGDQTENPDQAPLAVDGKADTTWHTNRYRTATFNKSKPGVGLVLDLGHAQVVRQVKLLLPVAGTWFQIRAAGASAPTAPTDLDSYLVLSSADNAPAEDTLRFAYATNTRFILIWLTRLPKDPSGGGYRSGISEVTVSG
jgi:hypothetical protein